LDEKEREIDQLKRLYAERGKNLMKAKEAEIKARRDMEKLKEVLLFGAIEGGEEEEEDWMTKLDREEGNEKEEAFAKV
jgi:hypothetical protein